MVPKFSKNVMPIKFTSRNYSKITHTKLNWLRFLTRKKSQPNKQKHFSDVFVLICLFLDFKQQRDLKLNLKRMFTQQSHKIK